MKVSISFVFVYHGLVDVLSDRLAQARARGAVFSVLRRVEPWGLAFSGTRALTVHIIAEGAAWMEQAGAEPLRLGPQDTVLVTAGAPYAIVSSPGAKAEPIRDARIAGSDAGDGIAATVLCGAYVLEGSVGRSLVDDLPRVVVVPRERQDDAHRAVVSLLTAEVARDGTGQQALLDRLLDVTLVYTLRAWWASDESGRPGWYAALSDPRLRVLLEGLHGHPEAPWTLTEMARVAQLSRSALAKRFAAEVGTPPARYLADLRMQRAEDALVRTDETLSAIAAAVGYQNPFAFATAFRRRHGLSPGQWRLRERLGEGDRDADHVTLDA